MMTRFVQQVFSLLEKAIDFDMFRYNLYIFYCILSYILCVLYCSILAFCHVVALYLKVLLPTANNRYIDDLHAHCISNLATGFKKLISRLSFFISRRYLIDEPVIIIDQFVFTYAVFWFGRIKIKSA